jgi:serine/threonine protein kinase
MRNIMNYEAPNERQKDLIVNIKSYFNHSSETIFKQRNTIKIVHFEGEKYVVKSFKTPHLINQIAYGLFRDGKAKKSYFNSIKILDFVPAPIGYIEFKKAGRLKESYFVSEPFEYNFTIREPLTSKEYPKKEAIYNAFAKFTNQLHKQGVLHLDYSPGNILIKEHPWGYEFKIIDVNRMLFKQLSTKERLENFAKLWASNEDLTVIIKEYAKLNKLDEKDSLEIALKASQKHKDKKNFKKRLKGKKVVD